MVSRFQSFVWSLALVACFTTMVGCAGSKKPSDSSSGSNGSEMSSSQKLEEARRSAEEAEAKAHQLREEKHRATAKSRN